MAISRPSFLGNKPQPIADILKLYPIEDLKDLSTIPRRWDCTYPQCMQLIKGEFPPRVFDSLMFSAPVSVNPKTKKAGLFKNGNLSS